MQKSTNLTPVYDPPFFLHKIHNYQKAVYERKGHWTQREKIKYGVFIEIFRHKFEDRKDPALNKMFRVMSDFIKTRNHNQCRSHHQKMEKERFEIDSILDSIRSKYHPREYELFFIKYSRQIKAVNVDAVLNQKGFTPHKNVQKRRKTNIYTSQANITCEAPELRNVKSCQKKNKIENIEPIYEVLNCFTNQEKVDQDKIQLEKQIQKGLENQNSSKSKEENAPQPIFAKPNIAVEYLIPVKDDKANKKTAIDYEDDQSDEPKARKPKIVVFDIPPPPTDFPPQNPAHMLNTGHTLGMGMMPNFMNSMPHVAFTSQFQTAPFQSYLNFGNQFPLPFYRTAQEESNYQENLVVDMKSLEEKKKWHLSEANRLNLQMNEQLQKAKTCELMMEMMRNMKEMNDPRRGYIYPNGYVNPQL